MSKHKESTTKQQADEASVFHAKTPDANVVGVEYLRVLLTSEDGQWFAQGLEIDYAAQGTSEEDVKLRFQKGLECTIREHLRMLGKIDDLLVPAPLDVWREFYIGAKERTVDRIPMLHSQVSLHPRFDAVAYYTDAKAA